VYVARHGRIGPNFQPGLIRTYPGKRQRDSDIQFRRKSFRCFPCRTLEYSERFGNAFDVDVIFNDIRRAGEPRIGFRVTIRTDWIFPTAAAVTASKPISAPVGTTI